MNFNVFNTLFLIRPEEKGTGIKGILLVLTYDTFLKYTELTNVFIIKF